MAGEHPFLSAKFLSALAVLSVLWGGGVSLILADRLTLVGLLMAIIASISALSLYWQPVWTATQTGRWNSTEMPGKAELITAVSFSTFALVIALKLYFKPTEISAPTIPSAQDIADAVAVKELSLRPPPTLSDVSSILSQPPPQIMYVPVTKYVFRRLTLSPSTSAEAIGHFQIGGSGIGFLPTPSAAGIGTFSTASPCANSILSSVLADEGCKPINFGTSANPLFIQANTGASDQSSTSNASPGHH